MRRLVATAQRSILVAVRICCGGSEDIGVGIVIRRNPLLLLVPLHLTELLEESAPCSVIIHDASYSDFELLSSATLKEDQLALLRIKGARLQGIRPIRVPSSPAFVCEGLDVDLQVPRNGGSKTRRGSIEQYYQSASGHSIKLDIPLEAGQSGSPVTLSNELIAVSEGRSPQHSSAIAVVPSASSLAELRRFSGRRRRYWSVAALSIAVLAIAVGLLATWRNFRIGDVAIAANGHALVVQNDARIALKGSWERDFVDEITAALPLSRSATGREDAVAVGVSSDDGLQCYVQLLTGLGSVAWSQSISSGGCPFSDPGFYPRGMKVERMYAADFDSDSRNEILTVASFQHFPATKLTFLTVRGEVLAEYWHPGKLHAIAIDESHEGSPPLIALSGFLSDRSTGEALESTLFGLSVPSDRTESPALLNGEESWYYTVPPIDGQSPPSWIYNISFVNIDGDSEFEILASLTDGRFYCLETDGTQVGRYASSNFVRDYGDIPVPPLNAEQPSPDGGWPD